jgi:tetratricopeptide (TPR) repeat protein/predicted Ser/Thr protein kinase
MYCPQCGTANPPETTQCQKCASVLPRTEAPVGAGTMGGATMDSGATSGAFTGTGSGTGSGTGGVAAGGAILEPGRVLGNRYEILAVLGQGGMGAVYKVHDREVGGFAALKVIRPEMANKPEVLQRFKQELILARQVTHKNVIRIHDLGEADGVKFITMDFVEGHDLASLIRERGKFEPEEAAGIIAQVCRALDAAHTEGVVHRDLKPQNIMVDTQGRVKVMDFGIARSTEAEGGMTQTGALLGTPEYMSPEQAKGLHVDSRSDLFSLGIIFYEMLTGKTPFHAHTMMATIFKRTQEKARPPIELEATIPQQINDVVVKCLATEADDRFQSASEVLAALGREGTTGLGTSLPGGLPAAAGAGTASGSATVSGTATTVGTGTATVSAPAPAGLLAGRNKWIAVGAVVVVAALAAFFVFRGRTSRSVGTAAHPLSLAILPFQNASGDASLDWLGSSLSEMLRTDIGQSEGFRTVSPDRLHEVLNALGVTDSAQIDPGTLSRVAGLTDADMVLSGQYVKAGDKIQINAHLEDIKQQRTIPLMVQAANENALLGTVDQLAKAVQNGLSLAPSAMNQMRASAFRPSSKSVAALKNYSQGLTLLRQGNSLEALKQFQAATTADPNFALAYSQMAQTYQQLGQDQKAQQYSGQAVDLSSNLPATEKYLIAAADAQIANNYDRAVAAYGQLSRFLPDDSQVQFNLGQLYENHGDLANALQHYQRVLAADPKNLEGLLAVGRVDIKSGNPQSSLDPLNRALSLAVELNNQQGKAKVLQAIGIAYQFLNRPQDALENFQQSLDIKQKIGDKRGMAVSLDQIAQIEQTLGKPDDAGKHYQEELKIEQDIGDQSGMARALTNYGDLQQSQGRFDQALDATKKALQIYMTLSDQTDEATALNNIGNIYYKKGQYTDALTNFQQALTLQEKMSNPANVAMVLNNMGQSYQKLGQYDKALSNYLKAQDTAHKAGDRFWIAASSDSMASLFQVQGRYGAALKAAQESYQNMQVLAQKDEPTASIGADYGLALAQVGRFDEAQKPLTDALALARSLGNHALIALVLNHQAMLAFYAGDFQQAGSLFAEARADAEKAGSQEQKLVAGIGAARVAIFTGHGAAAAGSLRQLAKDADSLGDKYLSAQCNLYLGEALVASRSYAQAQGPLSQVARAAQDGGMQSLLPQAEFLMGEALRGAGQEAQAEIHFKKAAQLLREMQQEAKSDSLLKRADLKAIADGVGIKAG